MVIINKSSYTWKIVFIQFNHSSTSNLPTALLVVPIVVSLSSSFISTNLSPPRAPPCSRMPLSRALGMFTILTPSVLCVNAATVRKVMRARPLYSTPRVYVCNRRAFLPSRARILYCPHARISTNLRVGNGPRRGDDSNSWEREMEKEGFFSWLYARAMLIARVD